MLVPGYRKLVGARSHAFVSVDTDMRYTAGRLVGWPKHFCIAARSSNIRIIQIIAAVDGRILMILRGRLSTFPWLPDRQQISCATNWLSGCKLGNCRYALSSFRQWDCIPCIRSNERNWNLRIQLQAFQLQLVRLQKR